MGYYRQVNVDYSICNALNINTDWLQEAYVVYDVMCSYLVHFDERLEDMLNYLSNDLEKKIFGAVGNFFLAAFRSGP